MRRTEFFKGLSALDEAMDIDKTKLKLMTEQDNIAMIGFFTGPKGEINIVLSRKMEFANYVRSDKLFNFGAIEIETLEQIKNEDDLMKTVGMDWEVLNVYPVGTVMQDPVSNIKKTDLLLVELKEGDYIFKEGGVVLQVPEQYEIGVIDFETMLDAIKEDRMVDLTARMLFSEFYIMVMSKQMEQAPMGAPTENGINEYRPEENENHTGMVSDEYIKENAQTDFAKIYSL